MLIACFLASVLYGLGQCENIINTCHFNNDHALVNCVTGILNRYFSERRELTYVGMDDDNEGLLKTIHSTAAFSLISRRPTYQPQLPNLGYLITAESVSIFVNNFKFLLMDPKWNPYARFLIVIRSLHDKQLQDVFDVILRQHVNNVIVVNGTDDAHLYTYNPFDNYACGKYYTEINNYGLCSQATHNLYPHKLVTGLRNCTFSASLSHRPPLSIDPTRMNEKKTLLGSEEYIFKVLSEREKMNVIFNYTYNGDLFSTVAPNMTAIGPMSMLQNNETDVIIGGMMMVASRASAFTYLCGYHEYNNEIRFIVKSAALVPVWKSVYIEFDSTVWLILLLSLIVYSMMMIYLLRANDKSQVVLELLDNLLLHGRDIRCRMTLKCVLMVWVWFAYLINTFYQSSLVSITTDPSYEHQVANEKDLVDYKYSPCFSPALRKYLLSEAMKTHSTQPKDEREGCNSTLEAMYTVSKTKGLYTMVPNYIYLFNKQSFNNKWGESLIYHFEKPFAKFLFGFYFYKGFPISNLLLLNAMRMRESGLADKSLYDQYYQRTLKQRFSQKEFEVRFTIPWFVYGTGCVLSAITFLLELLTKNTWVKWRSFSQDSV